MPQINMHTTPAFEADLALVVRAFRLKSKSEAIRLAVREVAAAFGKHQCAAGVVETAPGGGGPPDE